MLIVADMAFIKIKQMKTFIEHPNRSEKESVVNMSNCTEFYLKVKSDDKPDRIIFQMKSGKYTTFYFEYYESAFGFFNKLKHEFIQII